MKIHRYIFLWNENKNTPYGHKQFHGVTREGQSRITPEDQEHAHSYTSWGGQTGAWCCYTEHRYLSSGFATYSGRELSPQSTTTSTGEKESRVRVSQQLYRRASVPASVLNPPPWYGILQKNPGEATSLPCTVFLVNRAAFTERMQNHPSRFWHHLFSPQNLCSKPPKHHGSDMCWL